MEFPRNPMQKVEKPVYQDIVFTIALKNELPLLLMKLLINIFN